MTEETKVQYSGKAILFDTNILMGTVDYPTMILSLEVDHVLVALESLDELDNLKTAEGRKGYQARRAIRKIEENLESINLVYADPDQLIRKTDDKLVKFAQDNNVILATNDIGMKLRAQAKGVEVQKYYETVDISEGYIIHEVPDTFQGNVRTLLYDAGLKLYPGEYVIFKQYNYLTEAYVKLENGSYELVREVEFNPGNGAPVKPKDLMQHCAMHSLDNNNFTIITGPAGTGKTLLSVTKMLEALQKGDVSKIVIFTNPTKARGAESMGFYKGDRLQKLLQNSIGAILVAKLGSLFLLEQMIEKEEIIIMPMSDIRGYEVPETAYLYISEAQNADVDLLQLAIQRASGGPMILEGDPYTQLDHWSYGGENNGLLRAIQVFKGFVSFAHIHLSKIYRSPIAERAAEMTKNM